MKKSVKGLLKAGAGIVVLASGMGLVACNGDVTTNKGSLPEKTLTVSEIYDKNNSSVVVDIPKETAGFLVDDVKETAIGQAGYTSDQKFKENEEAKVCDKINSALDYIESQIGKISELPTGTVNYYVIGESKENLDKTFFVISPVREDGTNVLFTVYENGELTESVIKINDVENMTTNEIWEAISQGDYEIISQNELDPSSNYEEPPVEETVSFDDIYNQVFGEGFVVADAQSLLNDLAKNIFTNRTNINILAVNLNNEFTIYADNISSLGRKSLTSATYKGSELNEITSYLSLLQQIENVGGWDEYINSFAPSGSIEEGSETHNKLLATLENIKTNIVSGNEVFSGLVKSDFTTTNILSATREELPASSNAFGEALLNELGENGEIVETYVGTMGGRLIDSTGMFGTGYYSNFDLVSVVKNGPEVYIIKTNIFVPWYNNSTNEGLYNEFLKDNGQYQLNNTQTTTINNPILFSNSNEATTSAEKRLEEEVLNR